MCHLLSSMYFLTTIVYRLTIIYLSSIYHLSIIIVSFIYWYFKSKCKTSNTIIIIKSSIVYNQSTIIYQISCWKWSINKYLRCKFYSFKRVRSNYIHLHHIPAHYRWDRGESVLCTYVPCCVPCCVLYSLLELNFNFELAFNIELAFYIIY